jgi:hypothetical protein
VKRMHAITGIGDKGIEIKLFSELKRENGINGQITFEIKV